VNVLTFSALYSGNIKLFQLIEKNKPNHEIK